MKPWIVGALAAALLLPTAAACSFEVEPPAPVVPLAAAARVPFTLTADCAPTVPGGAPRTVRLQVEAKPAWATLVVSPSTFAIDCASGRVEKEGAITATVTPEAPAYEPGAVELSCAYEGGVAPTANESARGSFPLTAAFFSSLEAQVPEAIVTAKPGERTTLGLDLVNRGNAPTRVVFELVNWTEGIVPQTPEPVTLAVGAPTRIDVPVRAVEAPGVVSRADTLTLRYAGAYARDTTIAGDGGTVSFIVQAKRAPSPGPDAALALVAVAGALLARRVRPSS